jgi:hypothetical protein
MAVVGGGLVIVATTTAIARALIVPRARRTTMAQGADFVVDCVFRAMARPLRSYERKDQLLAGQGAVVILSQLFFWLAAYQVAFSLIMWACVHSWGSAFEQVASSMFTLGTIATAGGGPTAVDVLAAASGLVVVAIQIAYLPTLYGAFNRRETEVTLLGARAGTPAWGPELLVRTRYGVAVRTDDLPALYLVWERWAADVAESHSNYPVLVRFRSPRALSSWLISLLAIMDSAAMLLALRPSQDRIEPRRALRMGFTALREIGAALGLPVENDPDPDKEISLTFEEFAEAVGQLAAVGFPMERDAAEAWPHFKGWRVNYETLAYALAYRLDAVPAPWSGPRRWPATVEPVRRPANRSPKGTVAPKGFVLPAGPAAPADEEPAAH